MQFFLYNIIMSHNWTTKFAPLAVLNNDVRGVFKSTFSPAIIVATAYMTPEGADIMEKVSLVARFWRPSITNDSCLSAKETDRVTDDLWQRTTAYGLETTCYNYTP